MFHNNGHLCLNLLRKKRDSNNTASLGYILLLFQKYAGAQQALRLINLTEGTIVT